MLRRLFGKASSPSPARFTAELSPDRGFCVIGDIHGCAIQLDRLLAQLDQPDMPDMIVCVGDYVDRGDQSAEVLDRLYARHQAAPDRMVCLMGNHERMMLDFLDAPERAGPRWLRYGGTQTLISYRLPQPSASARPEEWRSLALALRDEMGPGLEAWLRALPLRWQSGNVAVVHAAADPARPIDAQKDEVLLWGSPAFSKTPRADGVWIIHGHTIVREPMAEGGRISIDTGAFSTGRLTAAVLPGGSSNPADLRFLRG